MSRVTLGTMALVIDGKTPVLATLKPTKKPGRPFEVVIETNARLSIRQRRAVSKAVVAANKAAAIG